MKKVLVCITTDSNPRLWIQPGDIFTEYKKIRNTHWEVYIKHVHDKGSYIKEWFKDVPYNGYIKLLLE